jgi:hypothetical protein
MRRSVISSEMEQEIQRLHHEGHALSVIARLVGVRPKTLHAAARRLGLVVTRHARRSGVTTEQIQQMVMAYQTGEGTKALAALYGVHDATIARYLRAAGVTLRLAGFQQGEGHHAWRGGRTLTDGGYVLVLVRPDDLFYPMAQIKAAGEEGARYCLEHRLVMARHLGRLLTDEETVHHVDDRDRQNNAISNLQLRHGNHGKGAAFRCSDCGSCNIVAEALN